MGLFRAYTIWFSNCIRNKPERKLVCSVSSLFGFLIEFETNQNLSGLYFMVIWFINLKELLESLILVINLKRLFNVIKEWATPF